MCRLPREETETGADSNREKSGRKHQRGFQRKGKRTRRISLLQQGLPEEGHEVPYFGTRF